MNCNKIYNKNLVLEFDVNQRTNLDILNTQNQSYFQNAFLEDYGLNQYDLGKAATLNESVNIGNEQLRLEPISYYDYNGVITTVNSQIIEDNSFGDYLLLNGGYFNTVYKYEGYSADYLKSIFGEGIGIEMTFRVDETTLNNKSTLFYMGARGVDKFDVYDFNFPFTNIGGVSLLPNDIYTEIQEDEVRFTIVSESLILKDKVIKYIGKPNIETVYLYSYGILINPSDYTIDYRSKEIILPNLNDDDIVDIYYYVYYDESSVYYVDTNNLTFFKKNDESLNNNMLKICLNSSGFIEINLFNNNELLIYTTTTKVKNNSWNHVFVNLKPYINFNEKQLNDCNFNPLCGVKLYLNGSLSNVIDNVPYPKFRGIETDPTRQIGLPYNIFWGGDSFGLKNSFVFDSFDKHSANYNSINYYGIIEVSQNTSFIGALQKLRIYNNSVDNNFIRDNFKIENKKLKINSGGGRVIRI